MENIATPQRPSRVAWLATLVLALVATACGGGGGGDPTGGGEQADSSPGGPSPAVRLEGAQPLSPEGADRLARASVQRFLDRYVQPDGRVVRIDQGGDTVAEGQAYALLMTVATADAPRFGTIWAWTTDNLQRDDGLFANSWANGSILDPQAAADADLDIAHALILAGPRLDVPGYAEEGRRVAAAIVEKETVQAGGEPVLVAGPWAAQQPPFTVNPSYFSPLGYGVVEQRATGQPWQAIRASSYRITDELLGGDPPLPPDWAALQPDGSVEAAPNPNGGDPQYGYDAARVPIRMGAACDERARELAARMWPFFQQQIEQGRIAPTYSLDGEPTSGGSHPVALVAAAGAAKGAGEEAAVAALLDEADALVERQPSYYGAAWVALGRLFLTTDLLGTC